MKPKGSYHMEENPKMRNVFDEEIGRLLDNTYGGGRGADRQDGAFALIKAALISSIREQYIDAALAAIAYLKSEEEENAEEIGEIVLQSAEAFDTPYEAFEEYESRLFEPLYYTEKDAGGDFDARVEFLIMEKENACVRVIREGEGDRRGRTEVLILYNTGNEWKCAAKAHKGSKPGRA